VSFEVKMLALAFMAYFLLAILELDGIRRALVERNKEGGGK
jgi:hypothetical protein